MLVRYNGFGRWIKRTITQDDEIEDEWVGYRLKVSGVFSIHDENRDALELFDRIYIEYLEQSNHSDAYRHPEYTDYLFMPEPNPVCFRGEDIVEDIVEPPIITNQDKSQNKKSRAGSIVDFVSAAITKYQETKKRAPNKAELVSFMLGGEFKHPDISDYGSAERKAPRRILTTNEGITIDKAKITRIHRRIYGKT